MSPILGIIASSKLVVSNSYASIATTTLSSNTGTITFSSIPGTYTHLQLRCFASTNRGTTANMQVRFNSDSGSNYSRHYLYGDGASAGAGASASQTLISLDRIGGTSTTFGALIVDVLDYANTNKYKTVRNLGGIDLNGSGEIDLQSGLWMNTAAITSITLITVDGTMNFLTNSSFALYGIKGA